MSILARTHEALAPQAVLTNAIGALLRAPDLSEVLFNTVSYAYFFTIVFGLTWLLWPWRRLRLAVLLIASYIFYAGWTFVGFDTLLKAYRAGDRTALFDAIATSCKYIPLLFVATSVDYGLGVLLDRIKSQGWRKLMLIGTIVLNVGILVFFKYWNWGADTYMWLMRDVLGNAHVSDIHLRVELPIGISFFCFMSLSYVIDVYRRTIPACQSYLSYLTYISFFPHLVAGPIIRGRDLLPHLERRPRLTRETFGEGLFLIASGLFKKVVIGDYLAVNFVDRVFAEPTSYSSIEAMMAMYGYAVQVYCDFAGYSDVAIGSALLLGYRFKINFDAPFKSTNIVEFWRRWHISLSTWLRDYVYIPLGGSRKGVFRHYFNIFVTMVICGVWHGAAWTYFAFGCIQGFALGVTHWFTAERKKGGMLKKLAIPAVISLVMWGVSTQLASYVQRPGVSLLMGGLLLGAWLVGAVLLAVRHITDSMAQEDGSASPALQSARRYVSAFFGGASGVAVGGLLASILPGYLGLSGMLSSGNFLLPVLGLSGSFLGWRYVTIRFSSVFAVFANFTFVGLTFTMFRAASLDKAWGMYERILSLTSYTPNLHSGVLLIMLGALLLQWAPRKLYDATRQAFIAAPAPVQAVVLMVVAFILRAAATSDAVPFVYFQF